MINSTRAILDLEFDTFVDGHAEMSGKKAVPLYLPYLEKLYAEVQNGMRSGRNPPYKGNADLEKYWGLKIFDRGRDLNLEEASCILRDNSYLRMRPDLPSPGENGDTGKD